MKILRIMVVFLGFNPNISKFSKEYRACQFFSNENDQRINIARQKMIKWKEKMIASLQKNTF